MATIYVLAAIVGRIIDRFSTAATEFSPVDFAGFVTFPLLGWVLFAAQKAANIACGDRDGMSNARFTPAN